MAESARIAIVDDEPGIREMLSDYLGGQGFRVTAAADGAGLDRVLADGGTDLVLLDLTLPGEDGFSIARRLRALPGGGPGIIMVTGAGTTVDRVVGLELGADDYVAKPFDLRELLARVRAVLRRAAAKAPAAEPLDKDVIAFGPWRLDLVGRTLRRADGGGMVELTAMEFDLLSVLAQRPNRVLTRDQLLDLAHNRDIEPFDRSIDVRITRLRKKIETDPARPRFIKTMRGAGYMFMRDD